MTDGTDGIQKPQPAPAASPPATPAVTPAATPDAISVAMAGWFGITLTALALIAFAVVSSFSLTDSLGYAALAGTTILSIGLIALIVLSRAVGMIEPTAALGLPRGSIRALLALGLAIVFVAVASWTLGGLFNPIGPMVTQVTVHSDAERNSYWERYPASDYVVKESDVKGARPAPAAATSNASPDAAKTDAAKTDAGNANTTRVLTIYLRRPGSDQALTDMAKQILTISATVLVTIVGFYFGSNSSADAARTIGDIMSGSQAGAGGGPAKYPPVKSMDDLTKLASAITAISTGCSSKLQALGDDPMALLHDAVSGGGTDPELPKKLQAAEQLLGDLKAKSAACAVDASRAREAMDGMPANAALPQIQQAGDRLNQLKADAEQANQDFEQTYKQFSDARQYILQKTAKG